MSDFRFTERNVKPTSDIIDLCHRGEDHLVPMDIVHRGRIKKMTASASDGGVSDRASEDA